MRNAPTPEGRIIAAIACGAFALACAIVVSASSFDHLVSEFMAPRRWLLLAFGVGLNFAVLSLMDRFPGSTAIAILVGYALVVFGTLALGWRWGQLHVPVAFWVGNTLAMAVAHGIALYRAARRRLVQPDVQSSFLASRLWK